MTKLQEMIKAGDISMGLEQMYRFTPEQLQAIMDEFGKEQREECAHKLSDIFTNNNKNVKYFDIKDNLFKAITQSLQPKTGIKLK